VKVTEVEGITEYRLDNGLRVLLFPDQSKPTVTVNVTYLVGSRFENYGETGMAHLLEHLLFKGTKSIPDIGKEFNGRGMNFNGTTSTDRTNYYEIFQSSDENLEWALMMEAERMVTAKVAKEDLDSEMTVVRNEYERGENSPSGVLIKRLQSVAWDWHNYGNSTIGNRSDIENVEIGNLQAFYRRYYQPDNAVLLVAGKFDTDKTLQLISKYFGAIPRPERQLPKLWTVEPTQDGERSFIVRRVGDIQIIVLAYKVPSPLHPDASALGFASFVLSDIPSGRLHKALVETGKAAQVSGGSLDGVDGSLQVFLAVVKQGEPVEPVRDEMIRLVEGFAADPPTEEEMERARLNFANAAERVMNDQESIGLELSEYIALGDWRTFFLLRDRAQLVTAQQVKDASAAYFRRDNRTVGMFLHEDKPQRAEIPAAASAAEQLQSYQPKQKTDDAEVFDPSPENIERRVKRLEINGMKVALLTKKTRGETVFFAMSLPSGNVDTLFWQSYASALTSAMLMRGTSRYSREQLSDEFAKLKISGGATGFQTTRPNLAAAIRLAAHVLREPSFPADEFEQLHKLMATSLEMAVSDPGTRGSEAMEQHFNIYPKGDPRHSDTIQETLEGIKAVTLDDVKRFHKTFFNANHAMFAIVGDFDEAEVLKAIEESFGDWRNDTPYERVISDYRDIAATNLTVDIPDKENAYLFARINIDSNQNDPDYAALYLSNYIFGSGAGFDSRLMARIRVKDGLSYSVGSTAGGPIFGRAGTWAAQAIAAPQNIAKVETALREELDKVLKDGFTDAEIAKAKSDWKQSFAQIRIQDASLVSRLLSHLDSGRTLLTWDKAFEERMLALTPEQMLAALRKHIDPSKLTIVKAGDFSK
jgi:zinc protease